VLAPFPAAAEANEVGAIILSGKCRWDRRVLCWRVEVRAEKVRRAAGAGATNREAMQAGRWGVSEAEVYGTRAFVVMSRVETRRAWFAAEKKFSRRLNRP
jgi:hypothetical protein